VGLMFEKILHHSIQTKTNSGLVVQAVLPLPRALAVHLLRRELAGQRVPDEPVRHWHLL